MKITRRQAAINEACKAYEDLCKYRGIPCDVESGFYIGKNYTIEQIKSIKDRYKRLAEEQLIPASEKQINYIKKLANEFKEAHLFENVTINKYQASYLIELYKYANNLLYSNCPIAFQNETWEKIDEDIEFILNIKK